MPCQRPSVIWFMFTTSLFYGIYTFFFKLHQLGDSRPHAVRRNLTILLWHWPFGVPYNLTGNVCLEKYNIPDCILVDNRSFFSRADIVVFHHHELWTGRSSLPLHLSRPPMQLWVWLSLEPPQNNRNLSVYNGIFNWTMSYRQDADIFTPYGKLVPRVSNVTYIIPNKKTYLACWVVSNYKPYYYRSKVYQQLKNFIHVEVYGRWIRRYVSEKNLLSTLAKCSFYLAFENSVFKDYITEKLWRNSFQAGTVPVVLGPPRENYEAFVPPESFIHVDDFRSIRELASFLEKLASNKTRYESYLSWHDNHDVKTYTDWRERLCNICTRYHQLPMHKVYHNLHHWGSR
ncbi:alpha-(1,3)-fucosyltransferase 7 [Chanos chanos]|uniref:Fucosyltransferase n=1 Tax=Chanos chanos TaxID=29144 RepID=A0A6J2WTQ7_CHACN|nr:alpha-(1,3)-fucosyltransferase 7 [Chanos chanos]